MRTILFYTHAFSEGGAEIVFKRLSHAFAEAGDHVVFAADHPGAAGYDDTRNLRHVVLGASHWRSTLRLAGLMRKHRFDASFSALGAQNLKHTIAAGLAFRLSRCVLGYHGFAKVEPKLLSRISFWLSPITTRLAARTICVSDALLDDIATRWRGSRRRMLRLYNPIMPVDDDVVHVSGEDRLVLSLGRLVSFKRFEPLVQAFALVQPRSSRLVILGEGPERAAIEETVTRLGLDSRVLLPGLQDDTASWYRRASCLVVASEIESFGLTAAEAMSFGVPVVSTRCVGVPEVLAGCGRVVAVDDIAALSAAISATLAETPDVLKLKRRAAEFALPKIFADYSALVDALA